MEKYKWTINDINELEVKQTIDIEFGGWKKELEEQQKIGNIDDVLFL